MANLLVEMYDGNRYNVILGFSSQELSFHVKVKANIIIKIEAQNFSTIKFRFPIDDYSKISRLFDAFNLAPKISVSQLNAIYHNS